MKKPLRGTIFRIPLRKEEHASASSFAPHAIPRPAANRLLENFIAELQDGKIMLFLEHVKKIEIWRWEDGQPSPCCLARQSKRYMLEGLPVSRLPKSLGGYETFADLRNHLASLPEAGRLLIQREINVAEVPGGSCAAQLRGLAIFDSFPLFCAGGGFHRGPGARRESQHGLAGVQPVQHGPGASQSHARMRSHPLCCYRVSPRQERRREVQGKAATPCTQVPITCSRSVAESPPARDSCRAQPSASSRCRSVRGCPCTSTRASRLPRTGGASGRQEPG